MQCVTCGVALADAKAHYGSAFHTANAKRRAADLPPLTEEAFERMEHAKREQKAAALAADELVLYICDACGKRFGSEGQFSTHNGKLLASLAALGFGVAALNVLPEGD